MEKQIKSVELLDISEKIGFLDYTPITFILYELQRFNKEYSDGGYVNIRIKFKGVDCDEDPVLILVADRKETEYELNQRLSYGKELQDQIKRNKEWEEQQEKELYEKLRLKYEK